MKKVIFSFLLFIASIVFLTPEEILAAANEYYISKDSENVTKGMYYAKPNGKAKMVVKFTRYNTNKKVKKSLGLKDMTAQYKLTTKSGDLIHDFDRSIYKLQKVGSKLYLPKPVYRTESIYGPAEGYALKLYEMTANGNKKRVIKDYIPSNTVTPFIIEGSSLFYVTYNKQSMKEYDLNVYDLKSKKKKTLKRLVDSFWIQSGTIYFTEKGSLYSMQQNGEKIKQYKSIDYLYNAIGFEARSYGVTINDILIYYSGREGRYYYLDTNTGKSIKLPYINIYEGNQYIDYSSQRIFYTDKEGLKMYDSKIRKTKLIKRTKTIVYIHQVKMNAKKIQYIQGNRLYEIGF
ncbi:hypothetical protein MHH85_10120 [Viridibacillus sp. FSL E2-0187]|uniref:hypothetical protein n=1 Tax=Viridibacillus sp. FSL E2-0187 TaxID=2921362 RepID=UPI0030FB2C1C